MTQPVAAFLATSTKATTPEQMSGVYCDLKALDRLHRTVIAAEQHVNTQASSSGRPRRRSSSTSRAAARGTWRWRPAAWGSATSSLPCRGLEAEAGHEGGRHRRRDPRRHARPAVRPRPAGPSHNPPAIRTAAASLQRLAALEATYMALVARSWRHGSVSQSRRKPLEKQIPNAFKQATARVEVAAARSTSRRSGRADALSRRRRRAACEPAPPSGGWSSRTAPPG